MFAPLEMLDIRCICSPPAEFPTGFAKLVGIGEVISVLLYPRVFEV